MTPGRHVKVCQCAPCVARRWTEYKERIDAYAKQGIIPKTAEATVMVKKYTVKPHFRRNSRHLTKDEALKGSIEQYLKVLLRRRGA